MTSSSKTPDANAGAAAMDVFLEAYLRDLRAGRAAPLAEYLERFRGHEAAVEAAWRECHGEGAGPAAGDLSPSSENIGSYEIVRELGRGGQGVVYLARDTRLRREVALKVFPRGVASPLTALRMRREAEALSRIDDRGICSVYELGETAREAFIAMRYVRGRTLAEEIRLAVHEPSEATPAAKPRIRRVLRIFEEVARTIHKAHLLGIVHRDLKPGNVMIDSDDHPVVLDFGLARDDDAAGPTLTQTGDVLGTPAYMAPEQISGRTREADARCDVYALGVSLYETLALERPFAAPTREELARRILTEEPPDLRRIDRHVPRDVATVAAIAMAKDPKRRYSSALDLAEDLRRVLAGEPILARRPGLVDRAVRYVRRRPLQSALAVTGLAAAALGGYLALRWSDLGAEDRRRRAAMVEEALEAALDTVASDEAIEVSLARLDQAEKEAGPTTDVTVSRVLSLVRIDQPRKALEILDAARGRERDEPALAWARWRVMNKLGLPEATGYRASLGEPSDPLSVLVAGLEARESLARFGTSLRPEIDRVLKATLGLPAPRRAFHQLLVGLASEAGDTATAMGAAEAMIRLWPDSKSSWTAMGYACQRPDPARSVRCFRKAIDLGSDPRGTNLTMLLANAYSEAGDEEQCIRTYREALEAPGASQFRTLALPFYNLGGACFQLYDWEASVEFQRRALEILPKGNARLLAQALCNQAQSLVHVERFDEALAMLKQGHELGLQQKEWPFPSAEWIALIERHTSLIPRIDALRDAPVPPADEEATASQWAAAAAISGRCATAARWFRVVHGPDAVAETSHFWANRLFAAIAGLRAAEGEGLDASSTDASARIALRGLALGWLDADLDSAKKSLDSKAWTPARTLRTLQRWTSCPRLKPIRDAEVIARFPQEQREQVRVLWKKWEELAAQVRPAY
jgi:tetratricopeptide (TPR) repeat protein